MQHASRFVPHECCTARACDEASARHVNVFLCGHVTGWVGGSLSVSRSALLTNDDPMDDLDVNMAIWCILLSTTLQAAVHFGQD